MSYTCYTIKVPTQGIKVELDDDLRRLNFDWQPGADNGLSFAEMESQIRELFDIPAFTKLRFTYVDCDNDVVTMVSDRDLRDASVSQGLNPLRMKVVPLEQKNEENYDLCQSCYVQTGHHAGEYEVVDPPLPVDPVAEAQASMEALALQRIQHQNEIATMHQMQCWAQANASIAAAAAMSKDRIQKIQRDMIAIAGWRL
ncbi:hypothetical protein R1flu_004145 [Riccia fluitans]|uniref:PB1 domain-containing protein n=1 Tax=Riccia fluitans TaxID=41844 RepID=A0ABD1YPG0_9MARC